MEQLNIEHKGLSINNRLVGSVVYRSKISFTLGSIRSKTPMVLSCHKSSVETEENSSDWYTHPKLSSKLNTSNAQQEITLLSNYLTAGYKVAMHGSFIAVSKCVNEHACSDLSRSCDDCLENGNHDISRESWLAFTRQSGMTKARIDGGYDDRCGRWQSIG